MIAAPLLLFPSGWRILTLAVLPLIWIGNRLAFGHFVRSNPYNIVVLVLLLMVLVSLYATNDLAISLPKIAGILLGVCALYSLSGYVTSTRRFKIVVWCLLFGCAVFAVLAAVGTDWGQKVPVLERIGAWLPAILRGLPGAADGFHPAEVGGTLTWLLFLPIAAVIGIWPTHWRFRDIAAMLFSIGLVLLMLFILVLTQSRSAWLGIAAGSALFLLLAGGKGRLVLALGLAILVVVVIALGPDRIAANLTRPSLSAPGTIFNMSFEGRSEIWSRAIYGIQDFSFTGMGLGTFRNVVRVLYPLFTISSDFDIGHAHNELLQSGVDLGLPGLIAFVSLQLLASGLALRAYRAHLPKMIHWAVVGTLAGLAAHAVFGLTDAVALGAKPGIFLWLLIGLIAIVWQTHETADQLLQ